MKFLKSYPMGHEIDPVDVKYEQIDIHDIANALSNICRYTGHVQKFYSVAQHSVWVSMHLEAMGFGKTMQLWGLLHDATEAYLGDVTRKLKKSLRAYQKIENKLNKIILKKFDIPVYVQHAAAAIKEADDHLLEYEKSKILQGEDMPKNFCWDSDKAKRIFMKRYHELTAPVSEHIVAR